MSSDSPHPLSSFINTLRETHFISEKKRTTDKFRVRASRRREELKLTRTASGGHQTPTLFYEKKAHAHTHFCHLHLRHLADAFMLSDSQPAAERVHEYMCQRERRNKEKQTHFHNKAHTDGLEDTQTAPIQLQDHNQQWQLASSLQANETLQSAEQK